AVVVLEVAQLERVPVDGGIIVVAVVGVRAPTRGRVVPVVVGVHHAGRVAVAAGCLRLVAQVLRAGVAVVTGAVVVGDAAARDAALDAVAELAIVALRGGRAPGAAVRTHEGAPVGEAEADGAAAAVVRGAALPHVAVGGHRALEDADAARAGE